MGHVRPASPSDALWLAPRLREADKAEVRAASGLDPAVALDFAVRSSRPSLAMMGDQGGCIGLFGAAPTVDPLAGIVWMLATDDLERHSRQFLRESRPWIGQLHRAYPLLFNFVDARNEIHIRWLRWCGFTFINRHEEFGVERRPFYEFVRINPDV